MASISEDRILDFLDGRLASGDEEELLHTLAVSPERRQLLREHLRIREITTTLSGHERFSVPAHVTSSLFATLGTLGFSAPASTETILTRAPQLVRSHAANQGARLPFIGGRIAARSAWRVGLTSIASASVVSFMLGAGALYVFGSSLGIGALSNASNAVAVNAVKPTASPVSRQYSSVVASVAPSTTTTVFSNINAPVATPTPVVNSVEPVKQVVAEAAGPSYEPPIAISSDPRQHDYTMPSHPPQAEVAQILPDWYIATPSPLMNEQGIISVRYASGSSLNSQSVIQNAAPNLPTSSLSELKFTWHLWKFITARASMGMLTAFERTPDKTPISTGINKWAVTTSLTPATNAVFGGELGVTLDPLGIPLETSFGGMLDGGGRQYVRGGLFAHFEPFDMCSVSAGIEAIAYTHHIDKTLTDMRAIFADYEGADHNPIPLAPGTPASEWVGFIGPSLEVGWHF